MPRFEYIAINSQRKTEKGAVTAESAFAARKHLRSRGLHPTEIKQMRMDATGKSLGDLLKRGGKKEVGTFTKELSTMLNAGIKLTDALSVLTRQINDPQLRTAITEVRDKVVTGESFADALAEYPQYFDIIFISMIRVGEVTGTLADTLATMSAFMEKRQRLEAKMTTVMIYPAVLIMVCFIVVIVLMVWVIPKITEQLVKTGQELPWLTKSLMTLSELLTSWWVFVIIGGITAVIIAYKRLMKTERGALWRDKLLLSLPGLGPLMKQQILTRFTSTLATLLGSGLSMAESLRVVSQVTGNKVMTNAVNKARERILSGSDVASPLCDSGVIDPSIAHMITVGEKSGELEQMLRMISENLEQSSDLVVERLSAVVEPVIIVFMALVVGLIVFATFVPLIKYSVTQF
ncbi:MAG: type II secretion system F family protein [Planctomycetota bacterium]|jgi:type II secretory pathway component PulF